MISYYSGSKLRFFQSVLRSRKTFLPFLQNIGHLSLRDTLQYEPSREQPRQNPGTSSLVYSYGYEIKPLEIADDILPFIHVNQQSIVDLLGSNFRINNIRFWRNLHIPSEHQYLDIYSNIFHQDTVYDQNLIQIFVLLENVSLLNGPFEWYNSQDHSTVHKFFHDRSKSYSLTSGFSSVIPSPNQLTGLRGDYLLLNTGYHYHRDSIPNEGLERTIMSIGLFPDYTLIGTPYSKFF